MCIVSFMGGPIVTGLTSPMTPYRFVKKDENGNYLGEEDEILTKKEI